MMQDEGVINYVVVGHMKIEARKLNSVTYGQITI